MLMQEIPLPEKFRDHALAGKYSGFRECHTQPDRLLIYRIAENNGWLVHTGTLCDLFAERFRGEKLKVPFPRQNAAESAPGGLVYIFFEGFNARAGTPATTALAGTSLMTTAPAPM